MNIQAEHARASRRLTGRAAIITGGARGLGAAIALRFALEGADVALIDVADAREAAAMIASRAPKARVASFLADVTGKATVASVFAEVAERFGPADILVNNVGGGGSPARLLVDLDEEHWDGSLASNLKSSFL